MGYICAAEVASSYLMPEYESSQGLKKIKKQSVKQIKEHINFTTGILVECFHCIHNAVYLG